jgi:GAF domain-containing protein
MWAKSCWVLESDQSGERTRRAVSAQAGAAHALSIGLGSLVDGPEYLGAISIARHGERFTREEEELLEYLAGQAVVSIENASLHETVERQAVTDELTGLANVRAFTSVLDRELERSRRFETPLGLVILDLDDFKLRRGPREPDRGRRRRALPGEAGQEPRGTRSDAHA